MSSIDVDFSLALHNRTGKYFIGKDLLETPGIAIDRTYYWFTRRPPTGLTLKFVGRLQLWQVKAKTGAARGIEKLGYLIPRRRSRRRLLHLDPFTVATSRLKRQDIVLCHDLGPVTHPDLFAPGVGEIYSSIFHEISLKGPHMVFVSQDTQKQFSRLYSLSNLASNRVIYPAIRRKETRATGVRPQGAQRPYLLTVGSIGVRKNQQRCIEAFHQSGLASAGVEYIVCGGKEPGFESVAAAAQAAENVRLLPYVSDAELAWLYDHAAAFVLASQLEGFGMPVAEAVHHGLIPVVTKGSVLEEVAGSGAIVVDSADVSSISEGMKEALALTEVERKARLALLHEEVKRFDVQAVQRRWQTAFRDWTSDNS